MFSSKNLNFFSTEERKTWTSWIMGMSKLSAEVYLFIYLFILM